MYIMYINGKCVIFSCVKDDVLVPPDVIRSVMSKSSKDQMASVQLFEGEGLTVGYCDFFSLLIILYAMVHAT